MSLHIGTRSERTLKDMTVAVLVDVAEAVLAVSCVA
jgi:hypothetical protein